MRSVIIFLLILIAETSFSQVLEFSGTITEDTEWDYDTVKIIGPIEVLSGATLTISPGAYVEFQGRYNITCKGSLRFIGTAQKRIVLTTHDSTTFDTDLANMGWNGIQLPHDWDGGHYGSSNPNDSSVFKYCVFEYCNGGAIHVENFSKLRFYKCVFRKGTGEASGISFSYSRGSVDQCSFFDNYGRAINLWVSSPRIVNSLFINNNGGALDITESQSAILNNVFSHNSAPNGGAFLIHGFNGLIANNIIANNAAMNGGGALFVLGTTGTVILANNTIVNNTANYAPGVYIANGYRLYNNIIWNNGGASYYPEQIVLFNQPSNAIVHNCIIENGDVLEQSIFSELENVFLTDPDFIDDEIDLTYNRQSIINAWSVDSLSSAVNHGINTFPQNYSISSDISNNPRISYTTIDIGAVEYQFHGQPVEPDPGEITAIGENEEITVKVYPNPASQVLIIDANTTEDLTATMFDLRGSLLESRKFHHLTQFDLSMRQPGSYILIIKSDRVNYVPRRIIKH